MLKEALKRTSTEERTFMILKKMGSGLLAYEDALNNERR